LKNLAQRKVAKSSPQCHRYDQVARMFAPSQSAKASAPAIASRQG
jgi:hypothetical protein